MDVLKGYLIWREESSIEPYNGDPLYGNHIVHRNVDLYYAFTREEAKRYTTTEDGCIIMNMEASRGN